MPAGGPASESLGPFQADGPEPGPSQSTVTVSRSIGLREPAPGPARLALTEAGGPTGGRPDGRPGVLVTGPGQPGPSLSHWHAADTVRRVRVRLAARPDLVPGQ